MKKAFEDMTTYGYSRLITDLCLFVVAYCRYSRPFKNRRSFDFPWQSFLEACLYRFHRKKIPKIQIQIGLFLDFQFFITLARSGCRNDLDTFGFVGRI